MSAAKVIKTASLDGVEKSLSEARAEGKRKMGKKKPATITMGAREKANIGRSSSKRKAAPLPKEIYSCDGETRGKKK